MANIDPSAVVNNRAQIGQDVTIGPFCVIEGDVSIGDGCRLAAHVVIKGGTRLGKENSICEGAVLGGLAQHASGTSRAGNVEIGRRNVIRENVTVHRALNPGDSTIVGDDNLLMVGAHVGHDTVVGRQTIIANNVLLGGHVTVADHAYVGGAVAVHQFCRLGCHVMVGGLARITQDVPPFVMVDGTSNQAVGLNLVGLRRAGFHRDELAQLKAAYRIIYRSGLSWDDSLHQLKSRFHEGPAAEFLPFLAAGARGFVQDRRTARQAAGQHRRNDDGPSSHGLKVAA